MPDISAWPHYPAKRGLIPSGADVANPLGWQDNLDLIQSAINSKAHEAYRSIVLIDRVGGGVTGSPQVAAARDSTLTLRAGPGIGFSVSGTTIFINTTGITGSELADGAVTRAKAAADFELQSLMMWINL